MKYIYNYHFTAKTDKITMNKMLKEMTLGKFENLILSTITPKIQ